MAAYGRQNKRFDAFLSHNNKDKPQVEQIARWLEEKAGLRVWLDKWNILPGDAWQEEVEKALDASGAYVVFLGKSGLGGWHNEEMRVAIDERITRQQTRVIPVLLPGTHRPEQESKLPRFLRRLSWVKFNSHINEEENLWLLAWGIQGQHPEKDKRKKSFTCICPFRGLEVFREQDAPFFFGREHVVQLLLDYLEGNRFLAVTGNSGSGKSSVVQAGLLPALKQRAAQEKMGNSTHPGILVTIFTPQVRPLERLAIAIRQVQRQLGAPEPLSQIIQSLQSGEKALHYKAMELCPHPKTQTLLLVIDQFEELFTQTFDENERRQFIRLLLKAVEITHASTKIVLTMRSDFLGKCAAYPELNLFVCNHLFQIEPMADKDLRLAIEEPAYLAGLQLEEGLVSRILQDANGASGELPLVEHALLELYKHRKDNYITLKSYEEIGGIRGALTKRAEAEYNKLTGQQQEILRKMFVLRLIQPGEGVEDTRRRAAKEELVSTGGDTTLAREVLQIWTNARLLTSTTDETTQQDLIDVAHEALIRQWPRIQEWLKDERENIRLLVQLRQATTEWRNHKQSKEYLYSGTRLLRAEELLREYGGDLTNIEQQFIRAGQKVRDKSRHRRRTIFTGIVTTVLIVLILVSLLALGLQQANRKANERLAMIYRENGKKALQQGDELRYLHYSSQALLVAPSKALCRDLVMDVSQIGDYTILENIFPHNGVVKAIFSKDESKILTWSNDGTVRLWDIDSGKQDTELKHKDQVWGAVFSKDESKILTYSKDETAKLWNAKNGQLTANFKHEGYVYGATFSKDESKILTWSHDGTAKLWNAKSGEETTNFRHKNLVLGATFSKDESKILTWSHDGTAKLWDAKSGRQLATDFKHKEEVKGAIFSKDESKILSWSWDGTAKLWDAKSGRQLLTDFKHKEEVKGAIFSKDESKILSWSWDGTAKLWDTKSGRQLVTDFKHKDEVKGAVFSKDEYKIFTWSKDGTAKLWDVKSGRQLATDFKHGDGVKGAIFSKDESKILTWSHDGTAKLWDVKSGRQLTNFRHKSFVWGAIFSKDGSKILTWDVNGIAKLWEAANGKQLAVDFKHKDGVDGAVFSEDGSKILTWSRDSTVKLWNAFSERRAATNFKHEDRVKGVVFSKDESKILTWDENNTIRLWDVTSGQSVAELKHNDHVWDAVFSKDESKILSWSWDGTAKLWDAKNGGQITDFRHKKPVLGAIFSKDESKILTRSLDNTAKLWDAKNGEQITNFRHKNSVEGTIFSKDESKILTWSWDGTAKLWDVKSGQIKANFKHEGRVYGAIFSRDESKILTRSNDGTAKLWDTKNGRQITDFRHKNSVGGAIFSKDESKILTWSYDGTAKLWNTKSGEKITNFRHKKSVLGATFSKDESKILTWSKDGTAKLWDTKNGRQLVSDFKHDNWIRKAIFSKDESKILTRSLDGTAKLWDSKNGRQLTNFKHKSSVLYAAFSKNDSKVFTWDGDKVRIWDAASRWQLVAEFKHKSSVNGVVFSKDESKILTWGWNGGVKLWNIPHDPDFPYKLYSLQLQALSGTSFDPATGKVTVLPKAEWEAIREEYMRLAKKHAKTCRYPKENVYLRYFSKAGKREY